MRDVTAVVRPYEVEPGRVFLQYRPAAGVKHPIEAIGMPAKHHPDTMIVDPLELGEIVTSFLQSGLPLELPRAVHQNHKLLWRVATMHSVEAGVHDSVNDAIARGRRRHRISRQRIVDNPSRTGAGLHPNFVVLDPGFVLGWRVEVGKHQGERENQRDQHAGSLMMA